MDVDQTGTIPIQLSSDGLNRGASTMSTITPTQATPSPPLASADVYRFTIDEYERMAAVLDDSRVELIDGYLVRKMPKKPPHIWAVRRIVEAMPSLLPPGWTWWKEDPVRIPDFDEPEPDVAVLRGSAEDYRNRIPDASDVVLLIEVAERTLARDRGEKLTAYAKGGIAVYWIVNLVDRQVEVYTGPGSDGYSSRVDYIAGQHVPVVIEGVEVGRIAVSDMLS
jgi:Uma2 family endonuclease